MNKKQKKNDINDKNITENGMVNSLLTIIHLIPYTDTPQMTFIHAHNTSTTIFVLLYSSVKNTLNILKILRRRINAEFGILDRVKYTHKQ